MIQKRIPVIIDCDPGVDDAHALLLAMSSGMLDIKLISTVAGNMPVSLTTENALKVVDYAGGGIPVAKGCSEPFVRNQMEHSEMFHGKNGLGNAYLPGTSQKAIEGHSVVKMAELLRSSEEKIHVIALGPLTNIAMLIKMYPEVTSQIEHLTIMGGGRYNGNITKCAEFNFYCDAEAADIVMRSDLPMTLVDLDGCANAMLSKEESEVILSETSRMTRFVSEMWQFNLELADRIGDAGFVIHDSIAVAAVIDPAIIDTTLCKVTVSTQADETYGQSIVTENTMGNVRVLNSVNKDAFIKHCISIMRYYQ